MGKRYTLYGTPTSGPVYKVALALALTGQDYAYRFVDFSTSAQKAPEYLAINRYGQVPALVVESGPVLVQSAAILEYLAEASGKLGGADAAQRHSIREWLYWDADKLSPGIYRTRAIARGRLQAEPSVADFFRALGEDSLGVLQGHLQHRDWLVGDGPTIADVAVYGVVVLAGQGGFDLSRWPAVAAFVKRVEALSGWRSQAELAPQHDRA